MLSAAAAAADVIAMTTADPASVPSSAGFRELGNEEYRKGNHLKAAALYTRAIKDDPDNAALRSNRSTALLQLHKLSKALADADECIKLRPDWDKGYYRRGAALEALGRLGDVRMRALRHDCTAPPQHFCLELRAR